MLETLAAVAALLSAIAYVALGARFGRHTSALRDQIPIELGSMARVKNSSEFSASTVAMTISLATVVLAFFELAPYFGVWLFWPVITTGLGLLATRIAARRIWSKMAAYRPRRPTLHEFLGVEYGSRFLALVAALCTSAGFLGAYAVELTVGSRFLGALVPGFPAPLFVAALATVGLTYTALGGFRVVIVTDRIQMWSIWTMLVALAGYYAFHFCDAATRAAALQQMPNNVFSLASREGLWAFLVGIFVINVPTFLADMSVWQRIAGSQDPRVVSQGLWRSVLGSLSSWSMLVVLACLTAALTRIDSHQNPLATLLHQLDSMGGLLLHGVIFFVVLGLYGAMFSTASTQLIAVAHTLQRDVLVESPTTGGFRHSIAASRSLVVGTALVAMAVVWLLTAAGFSIADLVFAIYGAQLGLFPAVLVALLLPRERLARLGRWTAAAITAGFVSGWSAAILGKFTDRGTLVFLAPAVSLAASSLIVAGAVLVTSVISKNRLGGRANPA